MSRYNTTISITTEDTMTDHAILTYARSRVAETQTKSPEAAEFRHRMLTPFVVALRDEGGLSWEAIGAELGIGQNTARLVYNDSAGPITEDTP